MIISCPLCGGFHLLAVAQNYPVKITFFCQRTEKNINYDYLKQLYMIIEIELIVSKMNNRR